MADASKDIAAFDSRAVLQRRQWPHTLPSMNRLTRQEQLVLCAVLGLLLVGLAVKVYRTGHPQPAPAETTEK